MTRNRRARLLLLPGLWAILAVASATDLTAARQIFSAPMISGSITEDPQPFGYWLNYKPYPATEPLNILGHFRGDGRPDTHWGPDGYPVTVWSYNTGWDFDIVRSRWDGTRWTAFEFVTRDLYTQLDPRVFVDGSGTEHVAWWTPHDQRIHFASRTASLQSWTLPRALTEVDGGCRRPTVAIYGGIVRVGFERTLSAPGSGQEIVVGMLLADGSLAGETVTWTPRTQPLDVILHTEAGHHWLDWKAAADALGFSVYQASTGWIEVQTLPWTDPTPTGEAAARQAVRDTVLMGEYEGTVSFRPDPQLGRDPFREEVSRPVRSRSLRD